MAPMATAYEARHLFQASSDDSMDDAQFKTPMSPPPHLGHLSVHSEYPFSDPDLDQIESDDSLDEDDDGHSVGGFSPPAWRRLGDGNRSSGFWRRADNPLSYYGHARQSGSTSSFHPDDDVLEQAIRTRLPTGSLSPEKGRTPTAEPEAHNGGEDDTLVDHTKSERGSPRKGSRESKSSEDEKERIMASMSPETIKENYIRFAVRADIQQRTEPIETAINFFRSKTQPITKSWTNIIGATLLAILSISAVRSLFQPAALQPVPDLIKVANFARSFEPLIHYSEHGIAQVGDLQATGVAVWDLGESVRSSNMTAAPIIVKSLDDLSDSLKTLATELTKFFANVDGDIDGILIVMDWARRELTQVQALPNPPFSTFFSNVHNLFCAIGVLEDPSTGLPTQLGAITTNIFGMSQPQRTRVTLQRTFTEFLSVLEEAIENELQHSLALFSLFEVIDQQFQNLGRLVNREADSQKMEHDHLLSSLWTWILGPRASEVAKYERNRDLLFNVHKKSQQNKRILSEHNVRLLALKAKLESLRRQLISPLVRGGSSSVLSLEAQVKGLENVGNYLEGVRARQKGKLMEILYGRGSGAHFRQYGSGGGATVVDGAERNAKFVNRDGEHHGGSSSMGSWAS